MATNGYLGNRAVRDADVRLITVSEFPAEHGLFQWREPHMRWNETNPREEGLGEDALIEVRLKHQRDLDVRRVLAAR